MSPAPTADNKLHEQDKPQRLLQLGAMGLLSGIAICALGLPSIGGWIATASAVALVVGIHTFGRLGSDSAKPPPQALSKNVVQRRRKKRKKATLHARNHSLQPDGLDDILEDSPDDSPNDAFSDDSVTRSVIDDTETQDDAKHFDRNDT